MKPLVFLIVVLVTASLTPAHAGDMPIYGYRTVHTYPHDRGAYTEGLLYHDGYLYEATGQIGHSSVRKVDLKTGEVLQRAQTPAGAYGEGIAIWQHRLVQLSWRKQQGFVYDLATLKLKKQFSYPGEGWALTRHGAKLYMSDGTPTIRVLDANTLKQTGQIKVTFKGKPLRNINELEWVKGQIFANVWLTHAIVRIDPATGKVVGIINLAGLGPKRASLPDPLNDVLNGIAYDAAHDRLYVTGKCWPHLYQIRLVRQSPGGDASH